MIRRLQVYWIRPIPDAPFYRITHIAGRNPDGSRWELSTEDALAAMQRGVLHLYVIRHGVVIDVIAARQDGRKYLKCAGEGSVPSLLLALPTFDPGQHSPV